MRNGIKSICDYIDRDHYEARITFREPCFPKLYAPDANSCYWELRWAKPIPTEEDYPTKIKWCMAYNDDLKQIITLEDGTEMVYERTVYSVRITAIPISSGEDNFLVLCTDRKTLNSYSQANLELIVPPSEFNFIEFNGGTYRLRNSSDLDICYNDIGTELALTDIV